MNGRTICIQPLPGIGDMVWHLPYLHSVAAASPAGQVDLLTKRRSRADALLVDDPSIGEILWLDREHEHKGIAGFLRLVECLRRRGYGEAWVFHDSLRYAAAVRFARIAQRYGYGSTWRRMFYNHRVRFGRNGMRMHPIEKGRRFLENAGLPLVEAVPHLPVGQVRRARARTRFSGYPRPWIGVGIGSSEAFKQWGGDRYAALIREIAARHGGTFFLLGGMSEQRMAEGIVQACRGLPVLSLVQEGIRELLGVIAECELYVGNDTGFLNIAAAVDTRAIGLFGSSPPLTHDPRIHALLPEDGSMPAYGTPYMDRISIPYVSQAVLEHLEAIR